MTAKKLIQLNQFNNPGNAKWCEPHDRLECTKNKSRGRGVCHGPAIRGTDACKIHGGVTVEAALVRGEARISAWSALGQPEGGRAIDSGVAVLGMLQQSWLRAAALGELLRRQVVTEGDTAQDIREEDEPSASGLIGFRYGAAGKDGRIYVTNEETRALVMLESAERDRVVKYAKVAHDMGISQKMVDLAEKWGDVVVGRMLAMLAELELTEAQEERVPALIQAHIGSIELTSS